VNQGPNAGVFQLQGITEAGIATAPFGSWWQAAKHDSGNRIERWVLTTSVMSPQDPFGRCSSFMLQRVDDTLVTCNGLLFVIEGVSLEAVKAAWADVSNLSADGAQRKASSNWPRLPSFDKK
jgi:hypothetical protein